MSDDYLSQPLNIGGGDGKYQWNFAMENQIFVNFVGHNLNSYVFATGNDSRVMSRAPNVSGFSPYLNYDPRLIQRAQPEFIFPEGASKQRGRFELAFSQIGSSVMVSDQTNVHSSTVQTQSPTNSF